MLGVLFGMAFTVGTIFYYGLLVMNNNRFAACKTKKDIIIVLLPFGKAIINVMNEFDKRG